MAVQYLTCPFCGFEFDQQDTLCQHGCPLGALCTMLRCPSCEYEFPPRPRRRSWLRRLFRGSDPEPQALPQDVRTLSDLHSGEEGEVVCLGAEQAARQNTLAVFGIVPGARVTLLQRYPSCVVRVDETELALDTDIARDILVRCPESETVAHPSP